MKLIGIGAALVDISFRVSADFFTSNNIPVGGRKLLSLAERDDYLNRLSGQQCSYLPAGVVPNTLHTYNLLGGESTFVCSLGADEYSRVFQEFCVKSKITACSITAGSGSTGTCLVLVHPEGERTMLVTLAGAYDFAAWRPDVEFFKGSSWVVLHSYLLQQITLATLQGWCRVARSAGSKVVLSLGDPSMVSRFRDDLKTLLFDIDLLVGNAGEFKELSGANEINSIYSAVKVLKLPAVMTDGAEGAHVFTETGVAFAPAFACAAVDLTGAGDSFLGGLLYGLDSGRSFAEAAGVANFVASQKAATQGSRLLVAPDMSLLSTPSRVSKNI